MASKTDPRPTQGGKRILIVEDDDKISRLVEINLTRLGNEISVAGRGDQALALLASQRFDLVVLDRMLPDMDGLELCRTLRTLPGYIPVLMLTAKATESERIIGLETGADDYLAKPFSLHELLARIKAIFRHGQAMIEQVGRDEEKEKLVVGDITLDIGRRTARILGRSVELTSREFELLRFLARKPGRVHSRAELLDQIWGRGYHGFEHTVNSHINRLRAKIEPDASTPRYVLAVWGVGYKLYDPTDQGE